MNHIRYVFLLFTLCAVNLEITAMTGNTCSKKMPAPKGKSEWAALECKDNCLNYDVKTKLITKGTLCVASLIAKYAKDPAGVMDEASKSAPKILQCVLDKMKCMDGANKGKVDKKKIKELSTVFVDKTQQANFEAETDKCVAENYDSLTSDYKTYAEFTKCLIRATDKVCPGAIEPAWFKKLTE